MSDAKTPTTSSTNNHAQDWNYKYDHDPPRDVTAAHDENSGTSELDWDDDDFELSEIEPSKQGDDRDKEKDKLGAASGKAIPQGRFDDDWLVSCTLPRERQAATVDSRRDTYYQTEEFKRLNTPSSRKKSRCVECTRPLPENHDRSNLLCAKGSGCNK
jgi:hypothetical protein